MQNKDSIADYIKASGFAIPQAMMTTILTQPFRNVQILQQTTKKPGGLNTFEALQELALKGSFRGITASTMKLALQHALFNPFLLLADRSITPEFSEKNPMASALTKSALSTFSRTVLHPVDVLITRAISESSSPKGIFEKMKGEFLAESKILPKISVGYRGIIPESIKQVIGNGCLFFIKDQIEQAKEICGFEKKADNSLSAFDTMFTGLLIAVIKNLATQPIDTVTKVIQANQARTIGEAFGLLGQRAAEANKSLLSVTYRGFVPKTATSAIVMATTVAMLDLFSKEHSDFRQGR